MKPLKFTEEMVRAILEGRKTQTRRPIAISKNKEWDFKETLGTLEGIFHACFKHKKTRQLKTVKFPFGKVGDRHSIKAGEIEITNICVERLQNISEEDAIAEGFNYGCDSVQWFRDLWDSYAKKGYGWDKNPWVWVIEFKLVGKAVSVDQYSTVPQEKRQLS